MTQTNLPTPEDGVFIADKAAENRAYWDRADLIDVVVPEGVRSIGACAFECCVNMRSAVISADIAEIGEYAFLWCRSLKRAELPDGVIDIPKSCFEQCVLLESVKLSKYTAEIGGTAFSNCYSLAEIALPESLTAVCADAFSFCKSLRTLEIPQNVSYIGNKAFDGCRSLESAVLPDADLVYGNIFDRCSSLKSIKWGDRLYSGEEDFRQAVEARLKETVICAERAHKPYAYEMSGLVRAAIPEGTAAVGNYAFCECGRLKEIDVPGSAVKIGCCAFAGCEALEQVTLADGLKTIASLAFSGCLRLKEITVPDSVAEIEFGAFEECSGLESITFRGVRYTDREAFNRAVKESGCGESDVWFCDGESDGEPDGAGEPEDKRPDKKDASAADKADIRRAHLLKSLRDLVIPGSLTRTLNDALFNDADF